MEIWESKTFPKIAANLIGQPHSPTHLIIWYLNGLILNYKAPDIAIGAWVVKKLSMEWAGTSFQRMWRVYSHQLKYGNLCTTQIHIFEFWYSS